jgi:hypothetical protein
MSVSTTPSEERQGLSPAAAATRSMLKLGQTPRTGLRMVVLTRMQHMSWSATRSSIGRRWKHGRDLRSRRDRSAAASGVVSCRRSPTHANYSSAQDSERCSANNATRSSRGYTRMQAGLLSGPGKTARLRSGVSWSHLWSHSCKFSGVRSGLPSLGSGATDPNRTCLNHQPQNSKAREGQPSAGSPPPPPVRKREVPVLSMSQRLSGERNDQGYREHACRNDRSRGCGEGDRG